jgi:uncharacterized membrane protein
MAHCTKCGAVLAENAAFCGNCGASQSATPSSVPGAAQTGLDENLAGALCYLVGWITGLILFLTDKRPYVRFHAAQSIVVFGALNILWYVEGMFFGLALFAGGWLGFSFGLLIARLLELIGLILWLLLMIKAYQGQRFRVPVAADLADKFLGKA